ncbi:MAG TPA: hypothetical protein VIS95_03435 [Solirubrobacterales bacterium]
MRAMGWFTYLRVAALFVFTVPFLLATSALGAEEFDKYAIESASASLSTTQAGAHADFTSTFVLTRDKGLPYALTKDVRFKLPPGLVGNPQNIPSCTTGQLGNTPKESQCPVSSQVGVSEVTVIEPVSGTFVEPVYNIVPPAGTDIVARLGFFAGGYPTFVNVRVDPVDYSILAAVEGAPSGAGLLEATTTLWGVPADKSHDKLRITPDEALNGGAPPEGRPAGIPSAPFMTNPTDCATKRQLEITARSYQLPGQPSTKAAPFPEITGCGKLNFAAQFTAIPTNPEAFAPTGLDAALTLPQDETANGLGTSTLKGAVVRLPRGVTVNPAAGGGLEACSAEQVGYGDAGAPACPEAAKIATVEIEVPALERTLHGAVYQRTPEPGRLFRFWLVTDEQGVRLKLPAEITVDPVTGRLSTVFDGIESLGGLPQVPVEEFRLHVFGGPRAPLSTPGCGAYLTEYSFTPWSGKAALSGATPMQVTSGCGKGGFDPKLRAGTLSSSAGRYSPFTMTLTRQDGEANPETLSVTLPEGLLAKLGGVELCPEAAAPSGACPSSSRIGDITAAAGVGGAPLWVPQPGKSPTAVYLAGPYKGAPYSVIAKVPAQAGPFDLGTVVTRATIEVDPKSAEATIVTDPLPQILQGVPIAYRTIHVDVDRPDFTLNPTGCGPKEVKASLRASNGQSASPSDGFQATDCAKLGFKPKLSIKLKGGTKRGEFPALRAVVRPRAGDANFAGAAVTLPRSAFLEQGHIRTICTRVQFNAGAGFGAECPKGAIYGKAKAFTPLLDQPLQGPVYLRSSSHNLPDLVVALSGPIDVELSSRIDSVKGGIRSTFIDVPDAPVSKFILEMQGGQKGLIVNSRNLCKTKSRADAVLEGQNGRVSETRPIVGAAGCGKAAGRSSRPLRRNR